MFKAVVVGLGRVGLNRMRKITSLNKCEIVAVCDKIEEIAREAAKTFDVKTYFTDYRDLFSLDFDILFSFTGSYARRDHVVAAAEAGKSIFTEKPIASSIRDAVEIVKAVKGSGVPFQIGYQLRQSYFAQLIKKLVVSGKIGTAISCFSERYMPTNIGIPAADGSLRWYGVQELSGGISVDFSTHDFDLLRWFIGEVDEVYARVQRRRWPKADDHIDALLTFKNGCSGIVSDSYSSTMPRALIGCVGTEGTVITDTVTTKVRFWGEETAAPAEEVINIPKPHPSQQFINFFNALEKGTQPSPSILDGWKAVEIAFAAQISSKNHAHVKLPLETV